MSKLEILAHIAEIIGGVGTGLAAWFAWRGIKAWRDTLEGQAQFDAAKDLLTKLYKWKESFRSARSAFSTDYDAVRGRERLVREMSATEAELSAMTKEQFVFQERWSVLQASWQPTLDAFIVARSLWGKPIWDKRGELDQMMRDYRWAIMYALDGTLRLGDPAAAENLRKSREVMYGGGGKNDEFGDLLDTAVSDVENYLQQFVDADAAPCDLVLRTTISK